MVSLKSVVKTARRSIQAHEDAESSFLLSSDQVPDCGELGVLCSNLGDDEREGINELFRVSSFLDAWRGRSNGLAQEYVSSYAGIDLEVVERLHEAQELLWSDKLSKS